MKEGLVSFEKVRDWEARECQRHICEIQGLSLFRSKNNDFLLETELKLSNLYRKPRLSTYESERKRVRDWGRLECQRHICEIQGTPYRGISPIRNRRPLGPYSRTMPRALWGS